MKKQQDGRVGRVGGLRSYSCGFNPRLGPTLDKFQFHNHKWSAYHLFVEKNEEKGPILSESSEYTFFMFATYLRWILNLIFCSFQ